MAGGIRSPFRVILQNLEFRFFIKVLNCSGRRHQITNPCNSTEFRVQILQNFIRVNVRRLELNFFSSFLNLNRTRLFGGKTKYNVNRFSIDFILEELTSFIEHNFNIFLSSFFNACYVKNIKIDWTYFFLST